MSSNNWLSMMNRSSNRTGGSLARSQGLSPTMSFMPRSTSTSLNKHEPVKPQPDQQKVTVQLFRIMHLLNVKVKKSYLYSFCKIQQICKNRIKDEKCNQIIVKAEDIKDEDEEIIKSERLRSGIQRICVFESSQMSKISMRQESALISSSFKRLRSHSDRSKSIDKLSKFQKCKINELKSNFIKRIRQKEKEQIRAQILIGSLEQLITKVMGKTFIQFKQWRPELNQEIVEKEKPKGDLMDLPKQMEGEEVHRRRVRLREKKTNNAKPIDLCSKLSACKRVRDIHEDHPLHRDTPLQPCIAENMRRFLIIKPQSLVNCLPDLADTCTIFVPQLAESHPTDTSNSVKQSHIVEPKSFIEDFSNIDSCHTDRTNEQAAICHIQSTTYSTRKGTQASPLMRVQQLLNNMKNIQHCRSASKQKRLVNINIPKQLNQMTSPAKTPRVAYRNYLHQSNQCHNKSADKENIGVRLMTEKVKNQEPKRCLQQMKVKSTVLVKQKKGKCEKSQLFSARKMKLEIENIINRRNRQLRQIK